ncbi:hypothetical protein ACTMSW_24875 [Micromonospora sp. BQ11]|uniref:hypothetical protein n=1 Tax=Micromonospora sp. BQ11 TaxID=3452212 RepID=UPI003F8C2C49
MTTVARHRFRPRPPAVGYREMFVPLGLSCWQVTVAPALAVIFAQAAFLGHDVGHRQIFRSRRANDLPPFTCLRRR